MQQLLLRHTGSTSPFPWNICPSVTCYTSSIWRFCSDLLCGFFYFIFFSKESALPRNLLGRKCGFRPGTSSLLLKQDYCVKPLLRGFTPLLRKCQPVWCWWTRGWRPCVFLGLCQLRSGEAYTNNCVPQLMSGNEYVALGKMRWDLPVEDKDLNPLLSLQFKEGFRV